MKILHSADLHLDSPFSAFSGEQAAYLKEQQMEIPHKLLSICIKENCDLVLLSGDIFDGPYTARTLDLLRESLKQMSVPVFISPGNHDFCSGKSPYLTESWPDNVYIFRNPVIDSVVLPELSCRVYGAGYTAMDSPGLLQGFHASGCEHFAVAVLHGCATNAKSPYCPITTAQITDSGLDYLALGHVHNRNSFSAGSTLCAWPGCPMGRGYDETGTKGVLIVSIGESSDVRFLPLGLTEFHDLDITVSGNCLEALQKHLPPVYTNDFYRVTMNGTCDTFSVSRLYRHFSYIPHLEIRDHTTRPVDLWQNAGENSLEGIYFQILQKRMENVPQSEKESYRLAAEISRQLLSGQEVELP